MHPPPVFWASGGLGIPLLLAAAKAHGRQVRLERELEGCTEVTFGGENPPRVREIWRRDRFGFWIAYPLTGLAFAVLAWQSAPLGWLLLVVLFWAPSAAFVAAGAASGARFATRLRGGHEPALGSAWLRAAIQGSLLYWGIVAVLGGATVLVVATG